MIVLSLASHIEGKALLICVVSPPHISFIIDNLTQDWLNGRGYSSQGWEETLALVLTELVWEQRFLNKVQSISSGAGGEHLFYFSLYK